MIFKTENTSIIVKIIMVNVLLYLVLNAATLYGYYREDQARIDAINDNNLLTSHVSVLKEICICLDCSTIWLGLVSKPNI